MFAPGYIARARIERHRRDHRSAPVAGGPRLDDLPDLHDRQRPEAPGLPRPVRQVGRRQGRQPDLRSAAQNAPGADVPGAFRFHGAYRVSRPRRATGTPRPTTGVADPMTRWGAARPRPAAAPRRRARPRRRLRQRPGHRAARRAPSARIGRRPRRLAGDDRAGAGPARAVRRPGRVRRRGSRASRSRSPKPVDAILSTATFHWVPDHDALFRNLAAVLRPGGRLVAQCGGAGNIASVQRVLAGIGDGWLGDVHFETPEATTAAGWRRPASSTSSAG